MPKAFKRLYKCSWSLLASINVFSRFVMKFRIVFQNGSRNLVFNSNQVSSATGVSNLDFSLPPNPWSYPASLCLIQDGTWDGMQLHWAICPLCNTVYDSFMPVPMLLQGAEYLVAVMKVVWALPREVEIGSPQQGAGSQTSDCRSKKLPTPCSRVILSH